MTDEIAPVPLKDLAALMLRDPFFLAIFFCFLLIGADLVAIQAGGLTLRLVFPVLMTAFALLYLQKGEHVRVNSTLMFLFGLLALAGTVSTLNSLEPVKSIGYTIWVLFDFFAIITLGYNFTRLYPAKTALSLWFLVFRVHVVLVLAEIAWLLATGKASGLNRPALWFYEPSYLAIFMTAYFGSSLFLLLSRGRPYRFDFFLSLLGILATTSVTGMFGVLFCIGLNFLVARQRVSLLLGSLTVGAILALIMVFFLQGTFYYELIAGFLSNKELTFDLILDRGGDRWVRVLIGWNAFQQHPWFGIGIGGDSAYMAAQPLPDYAVPFVHPWTDLSGQPFCNVVVEVLGTMGIVGFIPLAGILIYAGWSMIALLQEKLPATPAGMAFFIGFFAIFLSLQLDGTILRYYLWLPLGLALGVMAREKGSPLPRAGLFEEGRGVPA